MTTVRLNFKELRVPTGIGGGERVTVDAREAVADLLYMRTGGIRAHALAMKVFRSQGQEDYTAEEAEMIRRAVERHCLPAVIDALRWQMGEEGGGR